MHSVIYQSCLYYLSFPKKKFLFKREVLFISFFKSSMFLHTLSTYLYTKLRCLEAIKIGGLVKYFSKASGFLVA